MAHATEGVVSDELYSRFIEDMRTKDFDLYIAGTSGSAELTSIQRKAASDVLKERKIPTYIITDSRLVRGIVTAASWLGVNAKPFPWSDIDGAMNLVQETLKLNDEERAAIIEAMVENCRDNGVKPPF